jgi:hypothetical protein
LTKNGEERIVSMHNTILRDERGGIYATMASGEDTTEHKQAERNFQERMNELETFYRATLGREGRVIELKQEVNELSEQLGKNKKYSDYSK